jgi:hypothetical protein
LAFTSSVADISTVKRRLKMGEFGEFSRVLKEQRKEQKLANPPRRRCYDWIVTTGSCHYAKNRSSFQTYERLPVNVTVGGQRVIGKGTVQLKVRCSPARHSATRVITLEDVLHIPDAICNGFAPMRKEDTDRTVTWTEEMVQGDWNGNPLWYGKRFCGLWKLALDGNPQGESEMSWMPKGTHFALSLHLSKEALATLFPPPKPDPVGTIHFTGFVIRSGDSDCSG